MVKEEYSTLPRTVASPSNLREGKKLNCHYNGIKMRSTWNDWIISLKYKYFEFEIISFRMNEFLTKKKIRGGYDKFPDFFRMGTFIDSTHMKL